jgi:hypothetical protein
MKNLYERRNFLKNITIAASGVAFLSSTSMLQAFNKNDSPFEGYNSNFEEKTDLRTSIFNNKFVTVKGKIFDKNNLSEKSESLIEIWHLSPNSKNFNHKAKMKVNANGEYSFITDYPNREEGKYTKIYFKVTNGDTAYFTELNICGNNAYINDKHYDENIMLGENLFPTHKVYNNNTTINFNIAV